MKRRVVFRDQKTKKTVATLTETDAGLVLAYEAGWKRELA